MTKMTSALLLASIAAAQEVHTTGPSATTGACSPAVSGNVNVFNFTCGIGQQQGNRLLTVLNKILANQLDPEAVNAKLDQIIEEVKKSQGSDFTQYNFGGINLQAEHMNISAASTGRRLTEQVATELSARLSPLPKASIAVVLFTPVTDEMMDFGEGIRFAFDKVGWEQSGFKLRPFDNSATFARDQILHSDPDGTHCVVNDPDIGEKVLTVLDGVGIKCIKSLPMLYPPPDKTAALTIFIGRDLSQ